MRRFLTQILCHSCTVYPCQSLIHSSNGHRPAVCQLVWTTDNAKMGCSLYCRVHLSSGPPGGSHCSSQSWQLDSTQIFKTFQCPAPVLTDPDIDRLLGQIVSKLSKFRDNLKCRTPSNWMIFWPRCKWGFWDMFNGKESVHCPYPPHLWQLGTCVMPWPIVPGEGPKMLSYPQPCSEHSRIFLFPFFLLFVNYV